jgi:hypothetical protein
MPKTTPINARRDEAIAAVARDVLRIELPMQHADTEHGGITTTDLRRALAAAYDAGRKSALP